MSWHTEEAEVNAALCLHVSKTPSSATPLLVQLAAY